MKPLICDIPYPSTDDLTPDVRSGQIISFAYATLCSELTAILQYSYHKIFMQKFNPDDADTLMQIAIAEMKHLHILGDAMAKLGVNPRYVQYPNSKIFFDTSAVSQATTPQKMLMDDIAGEMDAITEYKKMLFVLKNEQVAAIVQRIVMDEELHLEILKQMLGKYSPKPNCN